jgi:hypothetical protein
MPGTKPTQTNKRLVGRPSVVDGKRVQVYLDIESLKTAARLGNSNVSEGIRKALKQTDRCCHTP